MRRIWFLCMLTCLLPCWASATIAGNSGADTRYFYADEANREYRDAAATERPTHGERVQEVTGYWRFFLQVFRVIDRTPALRTVFLRHRPTIQGQGGTDHARLRKFFSTYGIARRQIAKQQTGVYTLQLAAFCRPGNLERFLAQLPYQRNGRYQPGTAIYRKTPKDFRFEYGDESGAYKDEPLYLLRHLEIHRVRYGIYENPADARRDAAEWARRYHVQAYVTRTQLSPSLTEQVLWGDLPGIYRNRQYVRI